MKIPVVLNLFEAIENGKRIKQIYRETDITYNYMVKLLNILENKGYIKKEKEGREIKVFVTKKGSEIREKVIETVKLLREVGEDVSV